MISIPLDILGLVIGSIGAITGIISLVWHILKNKPKLILESAYFKKGGFGAINARGMVHIGVRLKLRNLGHRPVTLESAYIFIGKCCKKPVNFKDFHIKGSSSDKWETEVLFSESEFKKLFENGKLRFEVLLIHTFNSIRKKGETDFRTGHFTLK